MRSAILGLAVLLLVHALPAAAADGGFRDRYPPSSIDSVGKADAAIADAGREKARVESEYRTSSRACMDRVLVNSCLETARDLHRKRLSEIGAVEVEANRFKRRDKQDRLDADRARKDAEDEEKRKAEAPMRSKNQADFDARQKAAAEDAARNARQGSRARPKPRPPAQTASQEEGAAAERAKNASDYAQKVKDANEHRVELERRRSQNQTERARKAEARAAKMKAATDAANAAGARAPQ